MSDRELSIRQKKILNFLINSNVPLTGAQLAKYMNISDRTVRSDIRRINERISEINAKITTPEYHGYVLNLDSSTSPDAS
ncbi:helix-turn-helix domain-containing protein [Hornefia porci]|uniref:HTH domain-containing protein n=1 Tax=Hornefia porci TaxID=2652292 RepID=UPI0009530D46